MMVTVEEYPSLAEGIGLENRQGCNSPRGFESLFLLTITAVFVTITNTALFISRKILLLFHQHRR